MGNALPKEDFFAETVLQQECLSVPEKEDSI